MPYKIDEDHFTGAVAQLVRQFKAENPGVGEFKATCHDGSTVIIRIRDKSAKRLGAPKAGDVKTVRGQRFVYRQEMVDVGGGQYAERVRANKPVLELVPEAEYNRALEARRLLVEWKDVAPGTPVTVRLDRGGLLTTSTRSHPWLVGGFYGTPVILVDGISGGYALERVRLLRE